VHDFSDLLTPSTVLEGVGAASRKALFQQLGAIAGEEYGLDAKVVAETLAAREKLGSTAFGGGVALPHGRLAGIERVLGIFIMLTRPIEFAAIDDLPVDMVFALLSPPDAGADHLKALARVSRAVRDRGFVAKLRGAGSPDALYALLTAGEARDAA
jgi:PTS system nitrogen regulatory IIA component